MNDPRPGSAQGLLAFLNALKADGEMNAATADAWKSASQSVLAAEGKGWGDLDLQSMDVQDQFNRFKVSKGSRYAEGTLRTYRQRFSDSVAMYLEHLADPAGFKASLTSPRRRVWSATPKGGDVAESAGSAADAKISGDPTTGSAPRGKLLTYPFPLQSGELAYLQLPVRVSAADGERLCTFIRSIAIPSEER